MKIRHKLGKHIFILSLLLLSSQSEGQDTLYLDLENVLTLAIDQAIDLKIAQSQASQQEYAFQKADYLFKPQLFGEATFPNLNRSIESRPLPDGTDAFVNRSTMYNGIGLALDYRIEKTGGMLTFRSNIERLDIFATDQFDYKKTYFIRPFQISYTHPLFAFNELKWEKEILSLLYLEFKENFARKREDILIEGIDLFSKVFNAQQRVRLNQEKIAETDSLIVIKKRLLDIGRGSKTEMLRLELDLQNNLLSLDQEMANWQQAQMELADFIGVGRQKTVVLGDPGLLQEVKIDAAKVEALAIQNDYVRSNFKRRLREAEAEKERASKNRDIQLNLSLSVGLNNTSEDFSNLLSPLLDQEIFTASIRAPITGYGQYELEEKIADEAMEQEKLYIEKEKLLLSREAVNLVLQFELLKSTLAARNEARKTAEEILQITRQQFLLGNASHSDITIATRGREEALIQYYQTLMDIQKQYYEIRRLCMYDFIKEISLH